MTNGFLKKAERKFKLKKKKNSGEEKAKKDSQPPFFPIQWRFTEKKNVLCF